MEVLNQDQGPQGLLPALELRLFSEVQSVLLTGFLEHDLVLEVVLRPSALDIGQAHPRVRLLGG